MIVHFLICYLTVVEGLTWRPDDYTTNKMIKTVKGEGFSGYFDVTIDKKPRRFTQETASEFLPPLFAAIGKKMAELVNGNFSIVPIPNSKAIVGSTDEFRTLTIARLAAKPIASRATVVPALRWRTEKARAHEGGTRDPQIHFDNLQVVERPTHPIVLFDDVLTTGSQMIASYRRLAQDATVPIIGVTAGHTVHEQREPMLGWSQVEVMTEPHVIDMDTIPDNPS